MSDDIEKQVERAMEYYAKHSGWQMNERFMRPFLCNLLSGKFREVPLPEIARPPMCWNDPIPVHHVANGFFVHCCTTNGVVIDGPRMGVAARRHPRLERGIRAAGAPMTSRDKQWPRREDFSEVPVCGGLYHRALSAAWESVAREFWGHKASCRKYIHSEGFILTERPCTCGFDEVMAGAPDRKER